MQGTPRKDAFIELDALIEQIRQRHALLEKE